MRMISKKGLLALAGLVAGCLLIGAVIGYTIGSQYRLSGSGYVSYPPSLGVYSDPACTSRILLIDWGTLSPGDVGKRIVYLRNEGDSPVDLTLSTSNWNPPLAEQYLTLSWNYTTTIRVDDVVCIEFSLAVSSSLTKDSGITAFSLDLIITFQG